MAALDNTILRAIQNDDLGSLSEQQKLSYYQHECERMGIDPASAPLVFATISGKLRLYARRTAGDMLAAKHGISTQITDGPEIRDKVIYCRVKATMPDGRCCEDVGTVAASDPVNGYMKAVTKATRRATLRLCGWGGLDESELETVPNIRAVEMPAPASKSAQPTPAPAEKPPVKQPTNFSALSGKQLLAIASDVDPADYPAFCERWRALLRTYDEPTLRIVRQKLETLPPVLFEMLGSPHESQERQPGEEG